MRGTGAPGILPEFERGRELSRFLNSLGKRMITDQPLGTGRGKQKARGEAPRYEDRSYRILKRTMDIVLASLLLIILFPVFLIVSLVIVLDDGFPVFFSQVRVGRNGKPFRMLKFRTMVKDAETILAKNPEMAAAVIAGEKVDNDPRILKSGHFLRRSSLDELPQLINVLEGSMSLVGPRPILPVEVETRGKALELYLRMKPGCAGLWQCSGRSDSRYEIRVQQDEEYYYRTSVRTDLRILCKTGIAVLLGKGAK